jgi:hypothetical protein
MAINQTIEEKIRQRRLQILVHSYIYYELNQNIVSDAKWMKWAKELAEMQASHPLESAAVEYAEQFKSFDVSTGAFFLYDDKIISTANKLLEMQSAPKSVVKKSVKSKKKPKGRSLI